MRIISFYTDDWIYPKYAREFKRDCIKFNIPYHIEKLESTGTYLNNCKLKPPFILECMEKFKEPLLWLDIDSSIIRFPNELSKLENFDIAAVPSKKFKGSIQVGLIYFNYTENSLEFVKHWIEALNNEASDDSVMSTFFSNYSKDLNIKYLTDRKKYYSIISSTKTPKSKDLVGVDFLHRLSASPSKRKHKRK